MAIWQVTADPDCKQRGRITGPSFDEACALGKGGMVPEEEGREGDEKTPMGTYAFRRVFYRPDREDAPFTSLPVREISPELGWCDCPESVFYNKLVQLPFSESHERLWRSDRLYDLLLVIGHNDAPVVPALGSCVFVHVAREGFTPTLGCVALEAHALRQLIRRIAPGDQLRIG